MSVKLLTEHQLEYQLEFLRLKRGCTGSSKSTLAKMSHCWKSHVTAQLYCCFYVYVHVLVSLPFGSISQSKICDCGIFCSCTLVFLTLCMMGNFPCFYCHLLTFFKINLFKKFFHEHYQSVKWFGFRSGPTFRTSVLIWIQTVFANVISRRQKSPLVRKKLLI